MTSTVEYIKVNELDYTSITTFKTDIIPKFLGFNYDYIIKSQVLVINTEQIAVVFCQKNMCFKIIFSSELSTPFCTDILNFISNLKNKFDLNINERFNLNLNFKDGISKLKIKNFNQTDPLTIIKGGNLNQVLKLNKKSFKGSFYLQPYLYNNTLCFKIIDGYIS